MGRVPGTKALPWLCRAWWRLRDVVEPRGFGGTSGHGGILRAWENLLNCTQQWDSTDMPHLALPSLPSLNVEYNP